MSGLAAASAGTASAAQEIRSVEAARMVENGFMMGWGCGGLVVIMEVV